MSLSMVEIHRVWAALKTSDTDVGSTSACSDDDDDDLGAVIDVAQSAARGGTPNADADGANKANSVKSDVATSGINMMKLE